MSRTPRRLRTLQAPEMPPALARALKSLAAAHRMLRDTPLPYLIAPVVVALPAWLAGDVSWIGQTEIAILDVLLSVLMTLLWGRGPGLLTAVGAVAVFDYFFVEPIHSFRIEDRRYLFTFALILAVSALAGEATAYLRFNARRAAAREASARSRFEFARALSSCASATAIIEVGSRAIRRELGRGVLLLCDETGTLPAAEGDTGVDAVLRQAAQQVLADLRAPEGAAVRLPGAPGWGVPVRSAQRALGMVLVPDRPGPDWLPADLGQVEAFATLSALALERVLHVELAQSARVEVETAQARNLLLAALSHDLRSPLTSMRLIADALAADTQGMSESQRMLVGEFQEGTCRMISMTAKLLEMARIESGAIPLRRGWIPIEELVTASLAAGSSEFSEQSLELDLQAGSVIHCDGPALERVLWNLVENALVHAGDQVKVRIRAGLVEGEYCIAVEDNGPGIPAHSGEVLFARYARADSRRRGLGLGLAICRAIVEAHGGRISAATSSDLGGARFLIELPQPVLEAGRAAGQITPAAGARRVRL